jgi:hypothetical protein
MFEVLTTVTADITICWYVMPYKLAHISVRLASHTYLHVALQQEYC